MVEAKRQLTGKSDLPKTRVANSSVELDPQTDKTINSSALTPSMEHPNTLILTRGPAEVNPLPDPSPPALIYGTDLSTLTPPILVIPTPSPLGPDQSSLALSPSPAHRLNSVTFGTGVAEFLPYVMTTQAPYPPPPETPTDDLVAMDKANAR